MEWVDGNIGSKVTMKYPAVYLMGEHAKGETLSIAFAGEGQHQDAGAKMVHAAPHTSSSILSKSVARGGGRTSYRGLVQVIEGAHGSKSNVQCDALLVDQISRSDTYPYVDIREDDVSMGHEATVSKVSDDQLFYLMSPRHGRGRGDGDDRARLRRADRQGAPDGVRPRAQPADRAADGRRRWVTAAVLNRRARAGARREPPPPGADLRPRRRTPCRRAVRRSGGSRRSSGCADCSTARSRDAQLELKQHASRRRDADDDRHRGGDRRRRSPPVRPPRCARGRARAAAPCSSTCRPRPSSTGRSASSCTATSVEDVVWGHVVIRVGAHARADGARRPHRQHDVDEFTTELVGDGAQLDLVIVNDWADDAVHAEQINIRVGRDATLRQFEFTLGGDLVRTSTNVDYAGPGGSAELFGLYFADAGQHFEHRLFVDHNAPEDQEQRGLQGRAAGRQGAHASGSATC